MAQIRISILLPMEELTLKNCNDMVHQIHYSIQIHWSYAWILFLAGFASHGVLNKDPTDHPQ